MSGVWEWGIQLSLSLQQVFSGAIPIFKFFTFLGTQEFYMLFMPLVMWLVDYQFAFRLGVMLMMSSGLVDFLKIAFHMPRPYWISKELHTLGGQESAFGFPSGHSMTPMSVYGLIAALVKTGWVTAVVAVTIFMIGASRVVLGVHFPTDILMGWACGLLLLWAYVKYEEPVKDWFGRNEMSKRVWILLAITVGFVVLTGVMTVAIGFEVPAEWVKTAMVDHPEETITPMSLDGVITSASALFGFVCGKWWLEGQGGFKVKGVVWWQYVLRIVIGIVGVLLFWKGLDLVFPDGMDLVGYSFRFVRYGLIGFWISGLGPWVFVKAKLAEGS